MTGDNGRQQSVFSVSQPGIKHQTNPLMVVPVSVVLALIMATIPHRTMAATIRPPNGGVRLVILPVTHLIAPPDCRQGQQQ
ncbi:MAG: hypothetical protein IJB00_01285 [Akkermansia sp.]|nr:hypothetical protein [Akkermansia sp.]